MTILTEELYAPFNYLISVVINQKDGNKQMPLPPLRITEKREREREREEKEILFSPASAVAGDNAAVSCMSCWNNNPTKRVQKEDRGECADIKPMKSQWFRRFYNNLKIKQRFVTKRFLACFVASCDYWWFSIFS